MQAKINAILWLIWLLAAVLLKANPVLYLTPLFALLSHRFIATNQHSPTVSPTIAVTGPSADFKHDLHTPIRLILSYCDVMTRANNRGQLSPSLQLESVDAIHRNAQRLETLVNELAAPIDNAPRQPQEQDTLELLLDEAITLTTDLMASHNIVVKLEIAKPLPPQTFNRMYLLQALLNLLRGIALSAVQTTNDTLTVSAAVHDHTLRVSFTSSAGPVQDTAANRNWNATKSLIEMQGGRLWLENDSESRATISLAFPLEERAPERREFEIESHLKQQIIVVGKDKSTLDLFTKPTSQFEVIALPELDALRTVSIDAEPIGVVLTGETQAIREPVLQTIADRVGARVPIVECSILNPQQRLEQLHAIYLAKPIDYDALVGALVHVQPPDHTVLIVDDNLDTTMMLARMLASMPRSYSTRKAHSAHAALALLQEPDHHIGAVLVDVSLPDMDGISLISHLRANERFARLPVVLMSAHQTLDFMTDSLTTKSISIYRQGGFQANELAAYIEGLLNVFAVETH